MNDFIRPYTEEEFNKAFLEAGYPEISRQYCHEEWQENFDSILTEDLSEENLPELKEHDGWVSDNIREQAWTNVKENSHVDTYVKQRELGHGHEWARLFCDELSYYNINDAIIYWDTYDQLRSSRFKTGEEVEFNHNWVDCNKKDSLSCKEYLLAVNNLAKGEGEIVKCYIDYKLQLINKETKTDKLLREAMDFRDLYESLINEGYDKEDAFKYALDLSNYHHPVFNEVYREAMLHGQNPSEAWAIADFCEESVINGYLALEQRNFKNKFTEPWQRELYASLLIKDIIQDKGTISTLQEKDIRKSLDLETI